jgi:DNA-binding response OmpR family regulator
MTSPTPAHQLSNAVEFALILRRRYSRDVRRRNTVLIVEDDADLRRMYRTALAIAGFGVQEAGDGFDALQLLDRDPPDLVVLDLTLPAISGFVVRQEIAASAHTRAIPVVVVTAADVSPRQLDVPCVLRKPVSPDRLINAVRECLTAGSSSAT